MLRLISLPTDHDGETVSGSSSAIAGCRRRTRPAGPRRSPSCWPADRRAPRGAARGGRSPRRIAGEGRPLDESSSSRPSPGPARSSRSAETIATTPTRRASSRRRRRWSSPSGRAPSSVPEPRSAGTGAHGQVDYEAELGVVIGRRRGACRRPTPSTTSSATPASTTSRRATSSSATASGSGASRSTRSARWARPRHGRRDRRPAGPRHHVPRRRRGLQSRGHREMYFGVAAIISYCSRAFTLEPGDVIATGTPGGVGVFRDPPRPPGRRRRGRRRDRGDRPARNTCRLRPRPP